MVVCILASTLTSFILCPWRVVGAQRGTKEYPGEQMSFEMRATVHQRNSRQPLSSCGLGTDLLPLIFELKR